jgi:putative phosphoesterase
LLQELIKFQGYDIVMYGHTHIQDVERYGGSYIINPGSLALPRDGMEGKFILMDIDQHGKPFFAENEMPIRRKQKQSFWEEFWDRF